MFDDKIAELNRQTGLHPPSFEKRTYTVSEIQDILGIGRNAAYSIVKKGISVRFVSAEQFGFQKEVLMLGLMKKTNPVKYAMTPNCIIYKTSAFEYHIDKRSSLAIWLRTKRRLRNEQNEYVGNGNGKVARFGQNRFILAHSQRTI